MLKRLQLFVAMFASLFAFSAPVLVPAVAYGQTIEQNLCEGVDAVSGEGNCRQGTGDVGADSGPLVTLIRNIIRFITIIVGAVSILMIIFAGFKYITSGGDSSKITSAKNSLVYAIIGLVIIALAQVIVRFVLTTARSGVN